MKRFKQIIEGCFCLVLAVFLLGALPVDGEEKLYTEVVRLHVLAEDDSRASQDVKLAVRDAILTEYGEGLASVADAEEARALLTARLPEIQATAERAVAALGADCGVSVALTEEYFDTRRYGDITLPAGQYTSLTVTLGAGEGQNWWCVLFPELCTEAALGKTFTEEELALSPAEYRLVTRSGYLLRFRTLELLSAAFDGAVKQ